MPYLSQLLGKKVVDSVGQPMGRIVDLAITVEEPFGGDFPPLTLFLVQAGKTLLRLRWELIADLNTSSQGTVCLLDKPRAHVTIGQEKKGELYLRRDVLDKQILDISNYRLVRVNDIFLIEDEEELLVAGVDISFSGLLRRLRVGRSLLPVLRKLGVPVRNQQIPWNQVEVMRTETGGKIQLKVPTDKLSRLHPTDLAALIHQLKPAERAEVIEQLDVETVAHALEEIDDEVAADLVENMTNERASDVIENMDPDEAADVLAEIDSEDTKEAILLNMDDQEEAADIKHLLSYPEGTAGALMTTDVVSCQRTSTADELLAHLRADPPEVESLHYIYLTDDDDHLVGVVSLAEVVTAAGTTELQSIALEDLVTVEPATDAEECARLIAKYDLLSLPVVDLHGQLLGVVTVDDVLDVIAPEEWQARIPRVFGGRTALRSTPAAAKK